MVLLSKSSLFLFSSMSKSSLFLPLKMSKSSLRFSERLLTVWPRPRYYSFAKYNKSADSSIWEICGFCFHVCCQPFSMYDGWWLMSEFLHLPSYIFHLTSYIFHLTSSIFHQTSSIRHLTSYIRHLTSYIFHHPSERSVAHAARGAQCRDDGGNDAADNLQNSLPSFFLHNGIVF